MTDIGFQLMQMLMCEDQSNAIFAQLGHHVDERKRGEIVELVQIEEERPPVGRRDIRPAESRKTDGRDEEAAQDQRAILTDLAPREIDEEHPPIVHDLAKMQINLGFDKDAIEPWV